MKPFLKVQNITKTFPGVKALSNVSIDFYSGEVHALLGENGAGKSTLIKIISGLYHPTGGEIFLEGKKVNFITPKQALDAGISVIHQELSIAYDLTVAENIFIGEEITTSKGFLNNSKMNKEAQAILDSMGIKLNIKKLARDLTAAEQQMVEIARIIRRESKVVIMDEPTSSLSDHEIISLFEQIKILKKKNITVIYISHRLVELSQICEKVSVLKDGSFVKTYKINEVSEKELVASMVGRKMQNYYNRQKHTRGVETIKVENLCRIGEFENISFSAYSGEILGFAGLIGAGRTEVMETLFGARKATSGNVFINNELCSFENPAQAINKGLGMVTEDRRRTGILLDSSVQSNIVLPSLTKHKKKFGFLNLSWEKKVSTKLINKLEIKTPSGQTLIKYLSGGNQQKVILGKWLIAQTRILILDEPTRGIDVLAKSEFYQLMNSFVADGGTIILISSELPEILGISDRIIVMSEGKITGEIDYKKATEEKVMEMASLNIN